jgi:hypothetical protein
MFNLRNSASCYNGTGCDSTTIRFLHATSPFWICPLTSRRTSASQRVSDNLVQAKCFVRRTSFFAIHVATCKKLKRGQVHQLNSLFALTLSYSAQNEDQEIAKCSCPSFETFQVSRRTSEIHQVGLSCRISLRTEAVQYS